MPDNKKHHYVPRFYLKKFSQNGKSISLFNLKSERKILHANLNNQCYKDYFYGKDQNVEYNLTKLETCAAEILNQIEQTGELPPRDSQDYKILLQFTSIQRARTIHSADAMSEAFDKIMKSAMSMDMAMREKPIDLSNVSIKLKNVAPNLVRFATEATLYLIDLHCKIIKNCTDERFITSDNPVVFCNQFMDSQFQGSTTGYREKGLKILFPINPNFLIIFYDHEVYRLGNDRKSVIELTNAKDVFELNTVQLCSCHENIYFSDQNLNCNALLKKAKPFLREMKARMSTLSQSERRDNNEILLMISREDVKINLKLSFLSIRRSAKEWRKKFRKREEQPLMVLRSQHS